MYGDVRAAVAGALACIRQLRGSLEGTQAYVRADTGHAERAHPGLMRRYRSLEDLARIRASLKLLGAACDVSERHFDIVVAAVVDGQLADRVLSLGLNTGRVRRTKIKREADAVRAAVLRVMLLVIHHWCAPCTPTS